MFERLFPLASAKHKRARRQKLLLGAVTIVCSAGLFLCGGMFLSQLQEYRRGEEAYGALSQSVLRVPQSTAWAEREPFEESLSPQEAPAPSEEPLLQVDFDALARINPDVIGWLFCPGTVISFPVVIGVVNTYYLTHLFDGTENSAGCLFLDSRCQGLSGKNSAIYGHHMKNGTLFASLENYQDQAYFDAHPCLYLLTPEGTLTIRLFSGYVTSEEGNAWQREFSSEKEFAAWLWELQSRSCFESPVIPSSSDRVITLSTCDYSFPDARFVCHGIVLD